MASSETLGGSRPKVIMNQYEKFHLALKFLNGESANKLEIGQEVNLRNNGSVKARDIAANLPIGVVEVAADAGGYVTVRTVFTSDLLVVAGSGGILPGDFVKPTNVVDSVGRPTYVACSNGDFSMAVVLAGGAEGAECTLGLLRSPMAAAATTDS